MFAAQGLSCLMTTDRRRIPMNRALRLARFLDFPAGVAKVFTKLTHKQHLICAQ